MFPSLPQNDNDTNSRNEALQKQREKYNFNPAFMPPLALIDEVPSEENFSVGYLADRAIQAADLPPNMLAARARTLFDPFDHLEDYDDLFTIIKSPAITNTYQTDSSFAEQRLSGVNPMAIRRLGRDHENDNTLYAAIRDKISNIYEGKLDFNTAINDGTLYCTNYSDLKAVKGGTYEKGHKYLPRPFAIFHWQSSGYGDRGELVPIAIQIDVTQPDSNIYTPFDEHEQWFAAKLCVQIADANHHEMFSHLGWTHFVMEPFAISTARQLAENHPINILLKPHFRFMLANNFFARGTLIAKDGQVDTLLAGTLKESLELVKDSYRNWDLFKFSFPQELKSRGMDDPNKLPHFPYRDDGQLLWNAIQEFVSDYVNIFYKADDTPQTDDTTQADDNVKGFVKDDVELQTWAKELSGENGIDIKVPGMPTSISSIKQLKEILTTLIFTCGPQHSAVNFPQWDYMAFVANMPFAAYSDPDRLATLNKSEVQDIDENWLLKFLPPFKPTAGQLEITYTLADYRYDKLGHYGQHFEQAYKGSDFASAVQVTIDDFQQQLNKAENKIDLNNKNRVVPYPFLKPSLVINSISI
ncbi:lipoxygenase (plasmid) [Acaryochloris sp. 'Moss Beach']|uniref:lipoxygenase family protein n=1 Tax=Acaryochloris sp. 'Moss Beach' TaxID=2740837 RepID=UPI001F36AFE1|nr:lipoxygenase family protein [Acaryochloris sp. 'Moss Beach']UJB73026.1 lipoxygenase [Acaryochloris sp. 'Moss Beach']